VKFLVFIRVYSRPFAVALICFAVSESCSNAGK
jgi:hypothetical protein